MPARSVCLVTLSLSEAGPGRFGRQVSVTDIYHTMPYPGRHQEQAPKQRCTFSSTTFRDEDRFSSSQRLLRGCFYEFVGWTFALGKVPHTPRGY